MVNTLNRIISGFIFITLVAMVMFYLVASEAIKAAAPMVVKGTVAVMVLGVVAVCIRVYYLIDAHRLQNKVIRAETANAIVQNTLASQRTAFELWRDKVLAGEVVKQLGAGLVHSEQLSDRPTFRAFGSAVAKQAGKMLPDQAAQGNLLDAIALLDNLLIVGGKGSGKTSLMQWLESLRQASGRTIILDSHAQPAQWQGDVIGQGRNYGDIRNAMIRLLAKMDQRYNEWSEGQSDFEPVYQFIDEFTLLPERLEELEYNIQNYSKQMLTEGRKVAFNCVWGIHSDRAAALGLKGAMDLMKSFDAVVHLKHNKKTGERYAFIDYGEGNTETRYAHPGPFVVQPKQAALQPEQSQIATAEQSRQTIIGLPVARENTKPDTEQQIMILHKSGQSASKICEIVYGYKNKLKVEYVKSVIAAATGASE